MVEDPTLPAIESAACVHALAPHASCRACVDSCPNAAWHLDAEGLALDATACDSCALCVPACPRSAISVPARPAVLHGQRGRGVAFAACARTAETHGRVPCLNAIGARDLDQLAVLGVRVLNVLSGDCSACARGAGPSQLPSAIQIHSLVRNSHKQTAVSVEHPGRAGYRCAFQRAAENAEHVDADKRRLFRAFIAPHTDANEPAQTLAYFGPVIDTRACTACDACSRICPDGALTISAAPPAYNIDPAKCTDCRLCIDVCDQNAIRIVAPTTAAKMTVGLDPYRCRACGAPYNLPHGGGQGADRLCRICTRKNHARSLFQVFKD